MQYNEKQQEIMTAAEILFANKGFSGTSVREIAEAANINVAMISYYFTSKEGLMEAIFHQRMSTVTERLESLANNTELNPFEKLEILVDDYINKLINQHRFHKLMYFEQRLDQNPAIMKLMSKLKKTNGDLVARLVKEGQDKNYFKQDIDVSLMMHTLIGTIMHSFMNREYYREAHGMQDLTDEQFIDDYKAILKNYMKDLIKSLLSNERAKN
ncbi:MAG: TetR family transcriptional regulator [Flavitalea sp.]